MHAKAAIENNTADTVSVRFAVFFKRFNSDSVFQISRIIFPLKVTIIGGEGESDTTKFLQKNWRFDGPGKRKGVIVRPGLIGKTTATVHLLTGETGASVLYNFVKRKDKWRLAFITDESRLTC